MKRHALALATLCLACWRDPAPPSRAPARTPEGALARVREALVTGSPPLDSTADTRSLARGRFLAQTVRIVRYAEENPLTEHAWEVALADLEPSSEPSRALAHARPWLGDGRCRRMREVPVPEDLRALPPTDPSWPAAGQRLRALVGERLRGVVAGDYRCGSGPVFRAHFLRGSGGMYLVGALEAPPGEPGRP
ncbi:MAG: hypothetical protein HY909_17585 [Deltaproteobacteria bacterium]|nr:hypothetical protein [Deltaproteobacteria bacterium]